MNNTSKPNVIWKVCEACGEPYSTVQRSAKYCSERCRQNAYVRRRRAKDEERYFAHERVMPAMPRVESVWEAHSAQAPSGEPTQPAKVPDDGFSWPTLESLEK
jgi:hypothetical protein